MRKRDLLWDALADEFGPVTNKPERGRRNAALAAIRESLQTMDIDLDHQAAVDQLRRRIAYARRLWGNRITITPMAIAANWTMLEPPKNQRIEASDQRLREEEEYETRAVPPPWLNRAEK